MKKDKKKPAPPVSRTPSTSAGTPPIWWAIAACLLTAIVFYPMLANSFTNWDDQLYILENQLLRGPDWKGIFTQEVVSNYHPVTMTSLAVNYQLSELKPFSYHFANWLLHILNTGLVFFLAFRLSEQNRWVALLTALFFGIHPMHVESVAWASERKDVLFTFFFLLGLLNYLRYQAVPDRKKYAGVLALFALSLLSKPAAVTFPVVLILIDWYQGKSLTDRKLWLEKLPFFGLALLFGILALQTQSDKAIADQTYYPLWQRTVFAVYGFGEYIRRFFWPAPLSAIHPFPNTGVVPASFYPGLLVTVLTAGLLLFFRKNKNLVFGIGFYAVNVALVLQFLAFGNAVIAERYTYVPYIGLAFALAMIWAKSDWPAAVKNGVFGLFLTGSLVFAVMSNRQSRVWKNSETLWTNAIAAYPDSYIARSNRGHYLLTNFQKYDEALADYTITLQTEPDHPNSLENRCVIYLNKQNYTAALADAEQFVRTHPEIPRAWLLRAFTQDRLGRPDDAIADYTKCIELNPNDEEPHGNRGVIYFNAKQNFEAAKADFDAGIRLNPKKGVNYVNRARCWVKAGNKTEALKDLESARQLGEKMDENLRQAALNL